MRHTSRLAALTYILLSGSGVAARAQRVDPRRIIDFHVNSEERNVSIGGSVVEGTRFRMNIQGRGMYALSVFQLDGARQRYSVTLFRGQGEWESATWTVIETFTATAHTPAALKSIPHTSFVVDGTRAAQAAATRVPASNFTFAAYARRLGSITDYCCVSCSGITACGCAVGGSCGSCCVEPCCKPRENDTTHFASRVLSPNRSLADAGRRGCRTVPDGERLWPELRPRAGQIASR
ncbi:MAG TPA: hypothetical protein VF771_05385 [Longimicrobiaceae bacterium]